MYFVKVFILVLEIIIVFTLHNIGDNFYKTIENRLIAEHGRREIDRVST